MVDSRVLLTIHLFLHPNVSVDPTIESSSISKFLTHYRVISSLGRGFYMAPILLNGFDTYGNIHTILSQDTHLFHMALLATLRIFTLTAILIAFCPLLGQVAF